MATFSFFHGLIPVTGLDDREICQTLVQETSYETHPQSLKAVSWLFYLHAQVIDLKVLGSNEGKVVSSWDYDYIICYKGGICCLSLLTQSFDCATENALKKVKKYLELHHRKQNVTGEVFNGI